MRPTNVSATDSLVLKPKQTKNTNIFTLLLFWRAPNTRSWSFDVHCASFATRQIKQNIGCVFFFFGWKSHLCIWCNYLKKKKKASFQEPARLQQPQQQGKAKQLRKQKSAVTIKCYTTNGTSDQQTARNAIVIATGTQYDIAAKLQFCHSHRFSHFLKWTTKNCIQIRRALTILLIMLA